MYLDNINEIKIAIQNFLDGFSDFEILEHSDLTKLRSIRAEVNKMYKQTERNRIDYKKEIDSQVKEVMSPIVDKIKSIDGKIKSAIDNFNEVRKENIQVKLNKIESSVFDKIPKFIVAEYFFNNEVGRYTNENWEEQLENKLMMMAFELEMIKTDDQLNRYLENFDLDHALATPMVDLTLRVESDRMELAKELIEKLLKGNNIKGELV